MRRSPARPFEVCILAGGLSTRLGSDKARLKLGSRTMLARVRAVANAVSVPDNFSSRVRVIRKDCVQRCGPLGGIVTGLRSAKARAVLFLACDMPLISTALLERIARSSRKGGRPVFVLQRRRVGFPCLLPREALEIVERQIKRGEFSLQALAGKLNAKRLKISERSRELFNVNTPQDAKAAELLLSNRL